MHQKPSVQDFVKTVLLVELALFFTNVFEIINVRVKRRRQQDAELAEQGCSYSSVFQLDVVASRLFEIGTNFGGENAPQLDAGWLVYLHA